MSKKIFFFDIDETLTSEIDGSIPDSIPEALSLIKSRGDLAYVNTGRCIHTVSEAIRSLDFDGFVCGCGTAIYDKDLNVLWRNTAEDLREQIIASAEAAQIDVLFESSKGLAFSIHEDPTVSDSTFMMDFYASLGFTIKDPLSEDFRYEKFVCWCTEKDRLIPFLASLPETYDKIDRGFQRNKFHFFEIVPDGCSKAAGMKRVAELHQVPMADTYAFGDSPNDRLMLEAAGHPIVMGNSLFPEVRAMAEFVTDKASEDGILKAIKRIE